ncbi:MAG: PAS domain-containing protein, partial [Verrucomicrobiota bacterium]
MQEATRDGFWDWNLRSHQCFYGRAWLKMLGYAPGDLPESRAVWANLLHPDDQERVEQETRRFLAGDLPRLEIEYRMQHRAGHWVWVLDRGMVVAQDSDGSPLRAVGALTDITEHRRLTLLLGLVLEAGQVGYWTHHLADDSLVWGGHGSSWLGFPPGEMPRNAAAFMDWVHPEDRETVWNRYQEFLRRPTETFEIEFRIRNRDGRWNWVFTRALVTERDLMGRPARTIGIHLDCEQRKQAELELRQKTAELEVSNFALQRAARARDMFLANMSHEL